MDVCRRKLTFAGLAVSNDGHSLVTFDSDGLAAAWDPLTGDEIDQGPNGLGGVTGLSFDTDGRVLAITPSGFQWWDPAGDDSISAPLEFRSGGLSPALSQDGRLLASGAPDGSVQLWSVAGTAQARVGTL